MTVQEKKASQNLPLDKGHFITGDGIYKKNYENIYDLVDSFDGVDTAIKNAKGRMASFRKGIDKCSAFDPGTMVYQLVQELKQYLNEV